jgi:hypothetical protein
MPRTPTRPTDPTPTRPPLPLVHYGGGPTWPDRPTLGLKALVCPQCGHDGQRLMRAHQFWRDESDYFCPQIHVEMDFRCAACDQGWQMYLFTDSEGEGEIILDVKLVETVTSEDARVMDATRNDNEAQAHVAAH